MPRKKEVVGGRYHFRRHVVQPSPDQGAALLQAARFHDLLHEGLLRAQGKPIRLLGLVVGLPGAGEINQLSLDLS